MTNDFTTVRVELPPDLNRLISEYQAAHKAAAGSHLSKAAIITLAVYWAEARLREMIAANKEIAEVKENLSTINQPNHANSNRNL